jgi:hypothetical protein
VTPVTATADTEFTTAGTAVEVDAGANDALPAGVTAVVIRPPGAGSADVVDPGGAVFRYTPGDGFSGEDSFDYALVAAGDGQAPFRLATGTVTITRSQAVADTAASRFRLPVDVDVRANDVGAGDLQVRVSTPPDDGTVDLEEVREGVFRVTPLDGFAGTAEFTYELVHDGRAVDAAEVSVEVPEPTVARRRRGRHRRRPSRCRSTCSPTTRRRPACGCEIVTQPTPGHRGRGRRRAAVHLHPASRASPASTPSATPWSPTASATRWAPRTCG